jgi:hypothetical protein
MIDRGTRVELKPPDTCGVQQRLGALANGVDHRVVLTETASAAYHSQQWEVVGLAQGEQSGEQITDPVVLEYQHGPGSGELQAGCDRNALLLARHREDAPARLAARPVNEM